MEEVFLLSASYSSTCEQCTAENPIPEEGGKCSSHNHSQMSGHGGSARRISFPVQGVEEMQIPQISAGSLDVQHCQKQHRKHWEIVQIVLYVVTDLHLNWHHGFALCWNLEWRCKIG